MHQTFIGPGVHHGTPTKVYGDHGLSKLEIPNHGLQGDTGYDRKLFKEIGQKLGLFELAMISIGAYGPRYIMLPQHLDPAQAVLVHNEIRSQNSIAIHWGTFQLTHEPFLEPPKLLVQAMRKNGIKNTQFIDLKIGETIEIAENQ